MDLLLHRIGWSVPVPARRAAERDEARIAAWREDLAGGKRTAANWPTTNPTSSPEPKDHKPNAHNAGSVADDQLPDLVPSAAVLMVVSRASAPPPAAAKIQAAPYY